MFNMGSEADAKSRLRQIQAAFHLFETEENREPRSLDEMIRENVLDEIFVFNP
jgi:hypothetical protein